MIFGPQTLRPSGPQELAETISGAQRLPKGLGMIPIIIPNVRKSGLKFEKIMILLPFSIV